MPDELDEQEETQAESPKGKLKWILIAAGAVLVVILGGVGVWASGLVDSLLSEVLPEAEETAQEAAPTEVNEVVTLDPVVVNLVTGSRMSYARIGIALGIHNPSIGTPVVNEELVVPKVQDRLLSLVGEMDSDELLKPETKDSLKSDLLAFVNQLITESDARVTEVYFTDFIIQ